MGLHAKSDPDGHRQSAPKTIILLTTLHHPPLLGQLRHALQHTDHHANHRFTLPPQTNTAMVLTLPSRTHPEGAALEVPPLVPGGSV
jgi:hypothetical protein